MMDLSPSHLQDVSIALLAGVVLGVVFFGGLWLTVRHTLQREHVLVVLVASFLGRSAALLLGLWWIADGDPIRLLACAVAIFAVRSFWVMAPARSAPNAVHARETRKP